MWACSSLPTRTAEGAACPQLAPICAARCHATNIARAWQILSSGVAHALGYNWRQPCKRRRCERSTFCQPMERRLSCKQSSLRKKGSETMRMSRGTRTEQLMTLCDWRRASLRSLSRVRAKRKSPLCKMTIKGYGS